MVRRFEKPYIKGMTKSGLFNQNFGINAASLLFRTESKEEAETFFKKMKVENKKLKIGEKFYFYYFDKVTYNESGNIIAILSIDSKHDDIK